MTAVTPSLRVTRWTDAQFAGACEAWNALLARSDADPLFMSWDWQWRWWKHHRSLLDAELHLLAFSDEPGDLVGLAPFYAHEVRHRGLVKGLRLELIGQTWRDGRPMFSEYLDCIAAPGHEQAVILGTRDALMGSGTWADLVLGGVRPGSLAARLAESLAPHECYVRRVDPLVAHAIELGGGFESWLASLSADVRRRVFNQRRKLENLRVEPVSGAWIDGALRELHRWRALRWGTGEPEAAVQAFHREFAQAMAAQGRLELTRLLVGDVPVSVLYDVRAGGTEYYLQSAADLEAVRGVSIGYLHFGFAIERACAARVRRFDLLGGEGRHRDYKRDLAGRTVTLDTWQLVRAPALRLMYRVHAALAGGNRDALPSSAD